MDSFERWFLRRILNLHVLRMLLINRGILPFGLSSCTVYSMALQKILSNAFAKSKLTSMVIWPLANPLQMCIWRFVRRSIVLLLRRNPNWSGSRLLFQDFSRGNGRQIVCMIFRNFLSELTQNFEQSV